MTQAFSLLSYNIQAGIGTQRAHHYVTRAHRQFISTNAKRKRLQEIGQFISDYDVVCLQEVDPGGRRAGFTNQGDILSRISGLPHHVFQENRIVRAISRHGNAILSRIPIKGHVDLKLPGRVGGRGALIAELDMDPATVVVCVHLSLGQADQLQQVECLANHVNLPRYKRCRRIIAGDFNCGIGSPPIQKLVDLCDVRRLTASTDKTYPAWAPRHALDHILSDDTGLDHDVLVNTANYSDHRPVSAQFLHADTKPT